MKTPPVRKQVPAPPQRKRVREAAAQETRESILQAATKIFAKNGYSGGRIEQISKAANSYDRMIYYYFGSKEGLFVAVLEDLYRRFSEAESHLKLQDLDPIDTVKGVITFMWDFYQRNPDFITLLNDENLRHGTHIAKIADAARYSSPVMEGIGAALEAGTRQGVLRGGVSARDVYLMIASMNYFYFSNRYTLSAFLGEKLDSPAAIRHWHDFVVDAVLRALRP
jgi:TetR/AcrR family transcriptional regulator, upper aerobic nicotinate degradation pathway regulator